MGAIACFFFPHTDPKWPHPPPGEEWLDAPYFSSPPPTLPPKDPDFNSVLAVSTWLMWSPPPDSVTGPIAPIFSLGFLLFFFLASRPRIFLRLAGSTSRKSDFTFLRFSVNLSVPFPLFCPVSWLSYAWTLRFRPSPQRHQGLRRVYSPFQSRAPSRPFFQDGADVSWSQTWSLSVVGDPNPPTPLALHYFFWSVSNVPPFP